MATRKIVQFSVTSPGDGNSPYVLALADDGTLWKTRLVLNLQPQKAEWTPVSGLPEGEVSFDERPSGGITMMTL